MKLLFIVLYTQGAHQDITQNRLRPRHAAIPATIWPFPDDEIDIRDIAGRGNKLIKGCGIDPSKYKWWKMRETDASQFNLMTVCQRILKRQWYTCISVV